MYQIGEASFLHLNQTPKYLVTVGKKTGVRGRVRPRRGGVGQNTASLIICELF